MIITDSRYAKSLGVITIPISDRHTQQSCLRADAENLGISFVTFFQSQFLFLRAIIAFLVPFQLCKLLKIEALGSFDHLSLIMMQLWMLGVTSAILVGRTSEVEAVDLTIPASLSIGTCTAAYQVEGAWNLSGKGMNIWDEYSHSRSNMIEDGSNGDVACDSYHKYKDDVARIKSMGMKFYRFSISWSRVLPTGFANVTNHEGLQYYKNLTAELVANGIEPMATLLHLDHPQALEELGGWTNELMVDWFVDYARVMFEALGDHVKVWATINEPNYICLCGYEKYYINVAPGKDMNGTGKYPCMHNILKAHAKTYHMYDEEFRSTQNGEIGISGLCMNFEPAHPNDTTSAEMAFQFQCGWIFHPIFKGDYPEVMKTRIANISAAQGYRSSRLPVFTDEWISYIKGTTDYLGVNQYSSKLVSANPSYDLESDDGLITSDDPNWTKSGNFYFPVTPFGLRNFLVKIKKEYGNPPVRIMENGYADRQNSLDDHTRIKFHYDYMEQLLRAITEDGCYVKSYAIWSLLDSYEWATGYQTRFGLVSVDFNDPERTRTEKLSASWWRSVMASGRLQPIPWNSTVTANVTSGIGSATPYLTSVPLVGILFLHVRLQL